MGILRIAFELFMLYMLYKIVFDFIIPIYTTTKRVKRQFGEMQQKMEEKQRQQDQQNTYSKSSSGATPKADAEYIDYEEVK